MELDFILIGRRIKEIRISKGLTQVDLSEALECDPCYVSKLESGNKKASVSRLVAVADAMNVSVDELLGRSSHVDTEVSDLFSDCTPNERRLMLGALSGLKDAMRRIR